MTKFKPTSEQIMVAETLFVAMAFEAQIRPVVEGYQSALLQKFQFKIARKYVEKKLEDRIILKPKESYLLEDEDQTIYINACHEARDAANLKVDHPDKCPLLVAESLRMQAEERMIQVMGSMPGLENLAHGKVYGAKRKEAIDLILKLMAMYVHDADTILSKFRDSVH